MQVVCIESILVDYYIHLQSKRSCLSKCIPTQCPDDKPDVVKWTSEMWRYKPSTEGRVKIMISLIHIS